MTDHDIGVQTVVFGDRTLPELLSALDGTGVDEIELWGRHGSPEDGAEGIRETLSAADVSACGYGVVNLDDTGQAGEHVAFADRLGAGYVTVNYPPDRDDITEELCALGEEHGIDIAIHNYSSVHHDDLSSVFSTIEDVEDVLAAYDSPRLGVCVDTGHFLVEEVDPDEAIPAFGDRIVATHLKDTSEDELEDLPGAGRLELGHLIGLLDEHADLDAPLVIEYELPAERAVAALETAVANVRSAESGRS